MNRKIALVTGSNRGIGLETVRQLCALGYHCILTSRKRADGEAALLKLAKYTDQLSHHLLDVTDEISVINLQEYVEQEFGRLDALVNNAGWNYDAGEKPSTVDIDSVRNTLDGILLGPWRMCLAFVSVMKKLGFGRIVNVSSGSGAIQHMTSETPAYGVSKAALNVLTMKLAHELQGTGILVNSVCPGWVKTDMGGKNAPRSVEEGAAGIVWLADLDKQGPSGKFFRDKKEIPW